MGNDELLGRWQWGKARLSQAIPRPLQVSVPNMRIEMLIEVQDLPHSDASVFPACGFLAQNGEPWLW
jgi:hypothetical protein